MRLFARPKRRRKSGHRERTPGAPRLVSGPPALSSMTPAALADRGWERLPQSRPSQGAARIRPAYLAVVHVLPRCWSASAELEDQPRRFLATRFVPIPLLGVASCLPGPWLEFVRERVP